MSDGFEVSYPARLVSRSGKVYEGKDIINDNSKLRTGTTLKLKQAPERVKIIRNENKLQEQFTGQEKIDPWTYWVEMYKQDRKGMALDQAVAGMTQGISFAAEDGTPMEGDVKINITEPIKIQEPTFATYQHTWHLLDPKIKAKIIARGETGATAEGENVSAPHPLDFFDVGEAPKIAPIVAEFLAKVKATNIDEGLLNELEQVLNMVPDDAERLWREKFNRVISAIQKLAKEDAARDLPTAEEKLAQAADTQLGKMLDNPKGD
jgi:hypothetical protein